MIAVWVKMCLFDAFTFISRTNPVNTCTPIQKSTSLSFTSIFYKYLPIYVSILCIIYTVFNIDMKDMKTHHHMYYKQPVPIGLGIIVTTLTGIVVPSLKGLPVGTSTGGAEGAEVPFEIIHSHSLHDNKNNETYISIYPYI